MVFEKCLYGCVCVCVYVCVCVCMCVRVRVCVCVILTGQVLFSFFLCDGDSKIRFLIGPIRFCFISNFRFSQNCFSLFFLMLGSRYLNQMSSIRKRIKIPIFSKKKIILEGDALYRQSFLLYRP